MTSNTGRASSSGSICSPISDGERRLLHERVLAILPEQLLVALVEWLDDVAAERQTAKANIEINAHQGEVAKVEYSLGRVAHMRGPKG